MRVRRASAADEDQLRALDQAVWSSDFSPGPRPTSERRFFGEDCPPADVLVAIVDDRIAGYVRLARATPLPSNRHVLEIRGLAVLGEKRRHGVGRSLLAAAAREALARDARRLTLRVLSPNGAARALYERCGFKTEGVLKGEFLLGGRYVDDVLMALELGAGESEGPASARP